MEWKNLSIKEIVRDVAFLFFTSYYSGFFFGIVNTLMKVPVEFKEILFLGINYTAITIGFYFVAFWTSHNRLLHIFIIGIALIVLSVLEQIMSGNTQHILYPVMGITLSAFVGYKLASRFSTMK